MSLINREELLNAFGLSEKTRKYGGDHSGYDTRMLYEIQDTIEDAAEVEAIPVDWIEAEIKKLRDMDNGFASLSAGQIEAMLKKWREEQAPHCGPDYCEIGGEHND